MIEENVPIEIKKEIFRLYYNERFDTFDIKDEIMKIFNKNLSCNVIAKVLTSDLSKLYKDVNLKEIDRVKHAKNLEDIRNKERESNKDFQGHDLR